MPRFVHHELGEPVGVQTLIARLKPGGGDDGDSVREASEAKHERFSFFEDVVAGEIDLDEGVRSSVAKQQLEPFAGVELSAPCVERGCQHVGGSTRADFTADLELRE